MKTSGIGGQAVIEGIMMRNKDKYAISVRKPDNEIITEVKKCKMLTQKYKWLDLPIIRGVFNFFDSLVTGISTISYSASFFDDPSEQEKTKADELGRKIFKDKLESVLMAVTIMLSVVVAVVLFMLVPYFISRLAAGIVTSQILLNFLEGLVRLAIFILYLLLISKMNDIKRTYMYHGAEHKCINCIEHGKKLNVKNVMESSRFHKRCGTSFMFLVMFISIVFFIFIQVDNTALQIVIRILLVPVIAGVSYEILRLAGKKDSTFLNIISKPGMWMQKLTTAEPDESMVEVAINAVEAVFDWKAFLVEYYDGEENIPQDDEENIPQDEEEKETQTNDIPQPEKETNQEKVPVMLSREEERYIEQSALEEEILPDEEMEKDEDSGELEIEFENDENEKKKNPYDFNHEIAASEETKQSVIDNQTNAGDKDIKADMNYSEADDDGIEFEEESSFDDDISADDVPLFKQRKTDK